MTHSQLAKELHRSNYDITRLVDTMVKEGLAVREPGIKDRRIIKVKATKAGLAAVMEFINHKSSVEEKMIGCIDNKKIRTLNLIVHKLRKIIEIK
jgi:DNA-binding MarR family transcriptional regulator